MSVDETCVARKPLPTIGMLLAETPESVGEYSMSQAAILGTQAAGVGCGDGDGSVPMMLA